MPSLLGEGPLHLARASVLIQTRRAVLKQPEQPGLGAERVSVPALRSSSRATTSQVRMRPARTSSLNHLANASCGWILLHTVVSARCGRSRADRGSVTRWAGTLISTRARAYRLSG